MHSLDFDESECNLISSALEKSIEGITSAINDSANTEGKLLYYALAYSEMLSDLKRVVAHSQRDSYTDSEIKMIYKALKQLSTPNKDIVALLNSIVDYCKDFDIELP